jgi:uncharacterized protein YoxC
MEKITIAALDIDYQDVLDAMIETKKSIDVTRESTAELMKANKALEEDGKKGSDQWQKNARAIETNNVSLKGLTSEYSANQKVLTTNLHTKNAELGTIEKLDARNKELRLGLRGLNLETENGRKKQKEYITEIDRNTKFIKENSDAQVKQYMNVGNYKSALDGLPPSMAAGVSGFKAMGAAAKAFLANPLVLVITAVVGAVTLLVNAFRKTEEGGDKVKRIFDQVSAVVNVIKDRIENFALALGKIFSGEGKLRDLKGIFQGMGDEMKRDAEMAGLLRDALEALENKEIDLIVVSADRLTKIAKLKEAAADQNKTEKERIILLTEARRLMKEEADAQQEILLGKIANELALTDENEALQRLNQLRKEGKKITLEELGLSNSTNEDRRRVNELIKQYIDLEGQAAGTMESVTGQLSGLLKTQLALQEKINTLKAINNKEYLKEFVDSNIKALDEVILVYKNKGDLIGKSLNNFIEEADKKENKLIKDKQNIRLTNELETQQLIYDSRVANNDQVYEAEKQLLEAEMKAELANASKTGAERYLIEKKYSGYMTALARQEQEAKLAITSDFAGSLATLFGENTAVGRIAAVAQATINTYLGATSAFAQTPGGIVIKSLAAGAAIASGLASVKKILSTKSGLPGDSGGGSANISASVPGAGATSANFESDPTTGFTDQFSAIKNALAAQPPAVLVVEDYQAVSNRAIAVTESGKL